METTITIQGYSDVEKNGKKFTKFTTSQGNINVFSDQESICKALKEHSGRACIVEMIEKNGYKNIKGFIKYSDEQFQSPLKTDNTDFGAKEYPGKGAVPQETKVYQPTTMYVSYAKDIFNNIADKGDSIEQLNKNMELAIELIKQAHEAFK